MELGNHQLQVLPTRCCGEYLKSLETKLRCSRKPRRVRVITSSNRRYVFSLDITWGTWSYIPSCPREGKVTHELIEEINDDAPDPELELGLGAGPGEMGWGAGLRG